MTDYKEQYPTTWHRSNLILLCEVGSTAHGTGIDGVEDHDEMGIAWEPQEYRFGLQNFETMVWRPGRQEGEPSGPGDLDLTIHSIHKWVKLALNANPSIISMLFAPVLYSTKEGDELRNMKHHFISQKLFNAYLGYMQGQLHKLEHNEHHHSKMREELIAKHGYDTKYAMHALRLGLQGIELVETGTIQYPAKDRELLFNVRNGKYSHHSIIALIRDQESKLIKLQGTNDVPNKPNHKAVEKWMIDLYSDKFNERNQ